MTIRFCAALAFSATVLMVGGAAAKPAHPVHHKPRHAIHRVDVRYAQGFYDYRAAGAVHEEFRDGPRTGWRRGFEHRDFYSEQRESRVVENLRSSDFTGGVGYGVNGDVPGFVDGFGQTHFFVGDFRRMAPRPGFGAPRPGFHRGFR